MKGYRTAVRARFAWPLVIAGALVIGGSLAYAQQATPVKPEAAGSGQAATMPMHGTQAGTMPMHGAQAQTMLAQHQQLMADLKTMDRKLDDLVAKMNAAQGPDRIGAIEAVVNELVAERTQMRDRMLAVQGQMMQRMKGGSTPMTKGGSMPMSGGSAGTMRHGTQGHPGGGGVSPSR